MAQLWRCPVTWCTIWKGTSQDCVDHMRKAHNIPALVKAANLARWFPPWMVFKEQWTSIMRSSVSGVAVDTLLFSRIGVPLFHRYRVFAQPGTHVALHGSYMPRVHTFLTLCHCERVIVIKLGRLQHRCRGQRCRRWVIGSRRLFSNQYVSSVWDAGPKVYPSGCCCHR